MSAAVAAPYSLKRVQEMLGLSRAVVTGLISAGFVAPTRGPRREHRFSFQDLLVLRTAYELQQARIPPRKILQSLSRLKAQLPDTLPLAGLRISVIGADVAVRDRSGAWRADSGQLLMDFEVADGAGSVAFLRTAPPGPTAEDWFRKGAALEASDPEGAEVAYRTAIELSPRAADAYLNLGAMLCEAGRCDEAVTLYEDALQHVPAESLIHFNHAIALEDQSRDREALAAYERALALDAGLADAHYNLGVLLEKLGDKRGALRHFSAYRRLDRAG